MAEEAINPDPAENVYYYNNEGDNQENLTQEELEQMARNVAESDRLYEERVRQNKIEKLKNRRASRILRGFPGYKQSIARAKGRVNTRRKAEAREAAIANKARTARQRYKQNITHVANAQYGTNANFAQRQANAQFLEGNDYASAMNELNLSRVGKGSFTNEAVSQIKQTLRNAALEANARLYSEGKTVLESELSPHRQTVLQIAALDDLMVNERQKLAIASTNSAAKNAATRLHNIEALKEELDFARHSTKVATPDQKARYNALVHGFDFGGMNTSLYRRLVNNNANLSRKNTAATKIQALTRGAKGRKVAKSKRTIRNTLARAKAERDAAAAAAAAAVLTPAQKREARVAALAKRGLGGSRR